MAYHESISAVNPTAAQVASLKKGQQKLAIRLAEMIGLTLRYVDESDEKSKTVKSSDGTIEIRLAKDKAGKVHGEFVTVHRLGKTSARRPTLLRKPRLFTSS